MAEKVKLLAANVSLQKMVSCGLKRVCKEFNEIKIAKSLHKFYVSHAHRNTS
jgi:hypothetical protein